MSKDYYKTLGVDKTASEADIKTAFRKLAHQHHPDKNGNAGNGDKFKEINEAYQTLGNKDKRAQYDQFGSAYQDMGGAGGGNPFGQGFGGFSQQGGAQNVDFDLGDIFGSFFGGGGGRGARSPRGQDVQVDVDISLKEAVFGTAQVLSLRKQNSCEPCKGTGADKGTAFETCKTCNGAGRVTTTILGQFQTQTACPDCRGKGQQIKTKCGQCHGVGYMDENADIKVEIPAGIDDNQAIRLAGQGNSGGAGSQPGDLYVNVRVKPETGFERQGDDLITKYKIPFTMAALGGDIQVKTIDGEVKLKIPAGTESGKKFILKNKGVTRLRANGRGNQVVQVTVNVPTKLSRKQKKLLEELNQEFE
jgi:molecular chaperone DnaJ